MTSEIFYDPKSALCPDGKVRKVRVRCYRFDGSMAADTAFTVPAHLRVRGRYIHGYVTARGGNPPLEFCPHDVCKDGFATPSATPLTTDETAHMPAGPNDAPDWGAEQC